MSNYTNEPPESSVTHRNTSGSSASMLNKHTAQSASNRNLFLNNLSPPANAHNPSISLTAMPQVQQPTPQTSTKPSFATLQNNNANPFDNTVNWSHRNKSLYQQISQNDPADPNVVIVPKHPAYLSKLYRPNPKWIQSEEAFGLLRVETLALCGLIIAVAGIFAPSYWALAVLLALGCIICILGFIGAMRKYKTLLKVFFFGIWLWLVIIVVVVFVVLFLSDIVYDDALYRCENAPDYVLKFNTDPKTKATIDCAINMHTCFLNCVYSVDKHLTIGYIVFGGVIMLCLVIFMLHLWSSMKMLIFAQDGEQLDGDSSSRDDDGGSDSEYDEQDEAEIAEEMAGYQQGLGVFTVPDAKSNGEDDFIIASANPLMH